MRVSLKPIGEQVIVITGATSGIGLATARLAAKRGARIVLSARDEGDLARTAREIQVTGGQAIYQAADVADFDALGLVAVRAEEEWGGIDTWVNNAGVSIYGEIRDVPLEDARRLFETNYWGTVNGSLIALPYLQRRGGVLINVGSTVSDRAVPLQGHYSASKHAVKGFTDALRMEVERERQPVVVTLIKPGAIDTPFPEHARVHMDVEPKHPAPVYVPDIVADAILHCAEHPRRDMFVGAGGRLTAALGTLPWLADRYMEATLFDQQRTRVPVEDDREDTLFAAVPESGRIRGRQPGHVAKTSIYTTLAKHPLAAVAGVAVVSAAVALAVRSRGIDADA